jgi:hypothetical protein
MRARIRAGKAEELDPEVNTILGIVRAAWDGTDAALAKAGGVAESTWHAWRKGTTSPKFVDLQRVARVVKFALRLGADGGESSTDGILHPADRPRGAQVKPDTAVVVAMMEAAPDDLRAEIAQQVAAFVTERAARPLDADAGRPDRARRK